MRQVRHNHIVLLHRNLQLNISSKPGPLYLNYETLQYLVGALEYCE